MRISELLLSPATKKAIEDANIPLMHLLLPDCKLPPEILKEGRDALCSVIGARAERVTDPPPPIPSASRLLNDALGGGLPATRIIQLTGASLSGKTRTALSFASSVLDEGHSVIWLETTTSTYEVHTALRALSGDDNLSRFLIIPLKNFEHAISVLQAIKEDFKTLQILKPGESSAEQLLAKPRLIVLDSLATFVAPVLGLRTRNFSGHAALNQILALLRWLATRSSASIVVTNRVVRAGNGVKPALGNLLASYADVTMLFERLANSEMDIRIALSSKRGRDRDCLLTLSKDGIADRNGEPHGVHDE